MVLSHDRNILLSKLHAIDSPPLPTFGDVTGTEAINAVRHQGSVFQSILKLGICAASPSSTNHRDEHGGSLVREC
jgi:hypothetical protein